MALKGYCNLFGQRQRVTKCLRDILTITPKEVSVGENLSKSEAESFLADIIFQ